MRSQEAYYTRQKYLFALVFIAVSIVPLLILNYNASRFYQQSWMERTSLELATLAGDRRALIDQFLENQEDQLAGFMALASPRMLSENTRLATVFQAMNRNRVITDLGVIDRAGNHLAYQGPFEKELAGKNYAKAEWFAEVMRSGRYVSDVFTGYRKVPHLIVAVADPDRTWILRATINSALFHNLVASANVGPGGDAYIVNRRGELQTPSRHGHTMITPEEMRFFTSLADNAGTATRRGDQIYSAVHLNNRQWLLVLETDVAASLASYNKARRLDTALAVSASAVIVLVAVLLMHSMIGRLARAEQERSQLAHQVREVEKLALIGRLSASVAHEINNPLQIISDQAGLIDELLDEEQPDRVHHLADYRQAIGKIRTQIGRTSTITRRLLGFSRNQDYEPSATRINQAIEETAALLEHEAKRHRIELVRHYQPDLPLIHTDVGQLQQVILNLLHNAIDAIGQDGRIDIRSRRENDSIVVEFADTGPGLSDEVMAHLYDPFFTTKPKGKGTGLGLYVCRDIMSRLGGELSAGNQPGGGALFTLRLPLTRPSGEVTEHA
ncbi:MAG: ATP-binding protein [Pseudomonadota bacterium]